jgi:uncharacterized damage-inducible protein DinB
MRASVVLALLIAPLAAQAQSYKPGFNIFSPQQDYEIGRQSALAANRQLRTSTDARVTRIGKKLIARAPGVKFPYEFRGLYPALRNLRPLAGGHSVWQELEHMRLAQEDILRYTLDASWTSLPFPEGYWPKATERLTEEAWAASVAAFFADLDEVIKLAEDSTVDLTAEIPHGEGHTYLREILLVADHNAYHLGQIVQIRRALGAWS